MAKTSGTKVFKELVFPVHHGKHEESWYLCSRGTCSSGQYFWCPECGALGEVEFETNEVKWTSGKVHS